MKIRGQSFGVKGMEWLRMGLKSDIKEGLEGEESTYQVRGTFQKLGY